MAGLVLFSLSLSLVGQALSSAPIHNLLDDSFLDLANRESILHHSFSSHAADLHFTRIRSR